MADIPNERRKFKRVNAPMFCRPLGRTMSGSQETASPNGGKLKVEDISLGGVRVYTDDAHAVGEHLEVELWPPEGESITLDTSVVWVEALGKDDPAKFEIGLKFVDVAKADLERLEAVLKDV